MKHYTIKKGQIVSVEIGTRTVKAHVVDIPEYDPVYLFEPNTSTVTISPINTPALRLNVDAGICKILKN